MNKHPILFLADTTHPAQAVSDHWNAITASMDFDWHVVNPLKNKVLDKVDLSVFSAIGIHYSIKLCGHYYLSKKLKQRLAAYEGIKFIFLQDEYHHVNQIQQYLFDLKFDLLFTLVDQRVISQAYPDPRLQSLKKVTVLTGYVQDKMKNLSLPPIAERQIDVSYRARRCDYWLGLLAQEKSYIGVEFSKHAKNLKLDISFEESDRVYGQAWLDLLMRSRAVLGTESGASIWDFDGSIKRKTLAYLKSHKKANSQAVFEDVLQSDDGKIPYNCISPRLFEAAATKTPMVLFRGDYSGICKADIHYICLEKDFSNIDSVLEKLSDTVFLQNMADRTYRDLIESELYSQQVLSQLVVRELNDIFEIKNIMIPITRLSQINHVYHKYRFLNRARCVSDEIIFIIKQVYQLMSDPTSSLQDKFNYLYKGMKRYWIYLLPRFGL